MENNQPGNENCSLSKESTVDSSLICSQPIEASTEGESAGSSYAYILFNYISF